ncbi:hypothetical protein [Bradyrhizobium sp. 5.13L]
MPLKQAGLYLRVTDEAEECIVCGRAKRPLFIARCSQPFVLCGLEFLAAGRKNFGVVPAQACTA